MNINQKGLEENLLCGARLSESHPFMLFPETSVVNPSLGQ
jgi:hypothetical protein